MNPAEHARIRGAAAMMLAAVLAVACSEPERQPDQAPTGGEPETDSGNFVESVYERNFVFASLQGDSVFIVPWLMQTRQLPDSVMREASGWIARGGVWDSFYKERWWTPPTRAPNRILPNESLALLVGDEGVVDGIVFEDPPRSLEIIVGQGGPAWTGVRGGTFQLLTGSAYLADQRIDGTILDMARASAGSQATGGDWAFLMSGDSAHFVLAADVEHGGDVDSAYRAWALYDAEEFQWPDVQVTWDRTEAFPPARRDVPVEWLIASDDEAVEGHLEAVSAEIQAGEGPGPLLPVRALYEVEGRLSTVAGDFPVRGLVVHERR
ncbi:MAG: hypothetical protein HKN72_07535 [Gemmatimonadetes bacterium]|nr:hypothetical protein [Gemmatimonadota bacterium]NNF13057.1 hypothetical protein [Gemmatimonadota bacterium]